MIPFILNVKNKMQSSPNYGVSNLVNTYKTLEKWPVPIDQEFSIYAYFLYSSPENNKYGKQIFLGAYPTKIRALQEVEKIIKTTGHDAIYISETCSWQDIDSQKNHDRTFKLDPQLSSQELQKQFEQDIVHQENQKKKQEEIMRELEEQGERELNPTTLEHYVHNWYNAIKNKSAYEYHKAQMEHYQTVYNQRVSKIREQHQLQPELEEKWLSVYEQLLKKRGEENVFTMLAEGHQLLKEEILTKSKD